MAVVETIPNDKIKHNRLKLIKLVIKSTWINRKHLNTVHLYINSMYKNQSFQVNVVWFVCSIESSSHFLTRVNNITKCVTNFEKCASMWLRCKLFGRICKGQAYFHCKTEQIQCQTTKFEEQKKCLFYK